MRPVGETAVFLALLAAAIGVSWGIVALVVYGLTQVA